LKWDKKEVQKLLDKSEIPCTNLYIATGFTRGQGSLGPVKDVLAIKNKEDFLNGDFDQLMLLNKAGMMTIENSTLHLINKARDRFEEEQLKKIALVSSPSSQSQSQGQ
jgi:hypothetical protein